MRVLMIAATYPPTRCGVGDYVRRLGQELCARGAEVAVLTGCSDEHDHDEVVDALAPVGPCPEPRRIEGLRFEPAAGGVTLARVVESWDWTALDWIEAAMDRVRPDIISLQYHGEDYLLHPAICGAVDRARARQIPVVTTLHNLQQPRAWADSTDPLEHLLDSSAGWISTNTMDEARLALLPRASERLAVVTAGPCITAPTVVQRPPVGGPLRVGYFGFLNPFKGIEFLLRAVAGLRDEGEDLRLSFAAGIHTDAPGRLRDYAAFIDDELVRLDLAAIVDRQGYIPDEAVTALLGTFHLAVFPFRDGLSGKNSSFWSTLHHAVPALTTRGPGLPEGLVDLENVLLVPVDDAGALMQKLRWGLANRDRLEAIGASGRAFVLARFDWMKLADQTLEIFERALGAPQRDEARS